MEAVLSVEPCEDAQVALWPCFESPGGLYPGACEGHTLTTDLRVTDLSWWDSNPAALVMWSSANPEYWARICSENLPWLLGPQLSKTLPCHNPTLPNKFSITLDAQTASHTCMLSANRLLVLPPTQHRCFMGREPGDLSRWLWCLLISSKARWVAQKECSHIF